MSIYKPAKSPYFQYDFVWQGRRHHGTTGCTSRRDAERFEREKRRSAILGEDVKPTITIDDACGRWFAMKGQHLASHATAVYQLENLAVGLGKSVALADVTLPMLREYVARRRAKVSNASVNRETALFRRVVKMCAADGYDAPTIEWPELRLKEAPATTRVLADDEEARLFGALPESLKPIVEFALLSGQRKAEIVGLLWSNVDFIAGRAKVRAKGDTWHSFPLTPRMAAIIANQPKVAPQVFTYVAERSSPPRRDRPQRLRGQRYPFSRQGWDRKWRKALADAKIDDYRFHDNRHTALTRTGSIEMANILANHADMRTTQRYFHPREEELRRAMIAAESRTIPEPEAATPENTRKTANDR